MNKTENLIYVCSEFKSQKLVGYLPGFEPVKTSPYDPGPYHLDNDNPGRIYESIYEHIYYDKDSKEWYRTYQKDDLASLEKKDPAHLFIPENLLLELLQEAESNNQSVEALLSKRDTQRKIDSQPENRLSSMKFKDKPLEELREINKVSEEENTKNPVLKDELSWLGLGD